MSAHTYTAANGATCSLEVPDGYTAPGGLSMAKEGNPSLVAFIADGFVPESFDPPPPEPPPLDPIPPEPIPS